MSKFSLSIDLGNAAMLSPDDVARALQKVAAHLEGLVVRQTRHDEQQVFDGRIKDANGNTVGKWSLALPGPEY